MKLSFGEEDERLPRYDQYIKPNPVPLKYSSCDWLQAKIYACPSCFKTVLLGRDSLVEKYIFKKSKSTFSFLRGWIKLIHVFETENIRTEEDFKKHHTTCVDETKKDGIYKVRSLKQKKIAANFAFYSHLDQCIDSPVLDENSFTEPIEVYLYIEHNTPQGYIAFWKKDLILEGTSKQVFVLWDLYTFPEFRRKGIATKLLDFGVRDLDIDTDIFTVSLPITIASAKMAVKRSTRDVLGWSAQGYIQGKKEELKESVRILEAKYEQYVKKE